MNYVDSPFTTEQTILSIGFGQLGIERGVESTGTRLRVAAYVEVETFVIANLIGLMEKGVVAPAPIWADLKTFDARPFCGLVDFIFAGFPCQPFSVAGLGKGSEDPRHLFPHLIRIGKECKSKGFFLENVPGLITTLTLDYAPKTKARVSKYIQSIRRRMGNKIADRIWNLILRLFGRSALHYVISELESAGYAVKWGLYSAQEVGAPHIRKRVWILAVENSYVERVRGWNNVRTKGRYEIQIKGSSNIADCHFTGFWRQHAGRFQSETERSGEKELGHSKKSNKWRKRIQSNDGNNAVRRSSDCKLSKEQTPNRFRNNRTKWPAPPGPEQYEWEEPRTISRSDALEPGMGCSIDGYNFREDLLRLFGNGVVHQTAAKAWIELWKKIV